MKVMNLKTRWLVALAVALVLGGCVKVEQTLTLKKDGSGTLDMRYGMSEQTIAQMDAMQTMAESMGQEAEDAGSENPFDFDEAEVREQFEAEAPEGVELVSLNSESIDGWKYMNLKLTFDDLAALRETEFFSDGAMSLTKNADGNYVLVQSTGAEDAMPPTPSGGSEVAEAAMLQQMAGMFAGMRIVTTVVAPSEVIESNATETDGRKASWVFDVDEDPTVLSKLQNMSLRMVFKGKGVDIAEFGSAEAEPEAAKE
ncbi:hypothetical protein [Thiorhodovibrio frisius]|uniref:Lipoprotein n=1 Tax=Thiorhodovibrio frisius TaxID=631362 RepID=H8YY44_9GAMM|nr:hypothetical protein [Thiorhodovibrio frisius]EIC23370.1 hypothetical protein Thi970DRAFT_01030 [Thiorhodovibrio frisius]WPL23549.1 hypothetical protein Thiofri_03741 [Thiorhodovibrio frisius]